MNTEKLSINKDTAKTIVETARKDERKKVIKEIRNIIQQSYSLQCPDEGAEWLDAQLNAMEFEGDNQ